MPSASLVLHTAFGTDTILTNNSFTCTVRQQAQYAAALLVLLGGGLASQALALDRCVRARPPPRRALGGCVQLVAYPLAVP